jgi:nucleotide-binding universal stress UspA family protein
MTTTRQSRRPADRAARAVFERILVGVDGGPLSFDACRQAARLANSESVLEAAVVSLFPPDTASALGVPELAARMEQDAGEALLAAQRILGSHAELRHLDGLTVEALLAEAERTHTTLLAIGAPEHPRIEEIVLGGVGGELLHQAPCSMLLARAVPDEGKFPSRIVVGIDGSEQAERAYAVAVQLARRRHSQVQAIAALGGKRVPVGQIVRRHRRVETPEAAAVPALVEASACADLLVVGSRGLHGLRALGSVSERVAHRAACSVLVIR